MFSWTVMLRSHDASVLHRTHCSQCPDKTTESRLENLVNLSKFLDETYEGIFLMFNASEKIVAYRNFHNGFQGSSTRSTLRIVCVPFLSTLPLMRIKSEESNVLSLQAPCGIVTGNSPDLSRKI